MIKDDKGSKGGGAIAQPMVPHNTKPTDDHGGRLSQNNFTGEEFRKRSSQDISVTKEETIGVDTLEIDDSNSISMSNTQPEELDELSNSGSTPDPDSDDDTLKNAQAAGFQLEEDIEHPQELNMARDLDKAEEYHRTH